MNTLRPGLRYARVPAQRCARLPPAGLARIAPRPDSIFRSPNRTRVRFRAAELFPPARIPFFGTKSRPGQTAARRNLHQSDRLLFERPARPRPADLGGSV